MVSDAPKTRRDVVFISKATPGDDEFVLWLAPRLEAAGYTVFADILNLQAGSRWRMDITGTLQDRAVKMLLCCSDATLARQGVQEEIGIASDLVRQLHDPRFIIPLRLEPYKKLFGIGELQWVDFSKSWAEGLANLLDALEEEKVPRRVENATINPNWHIYRKRKAIELKREPEVLASNWLRITDYPDSIRYFEPSGAVNIGAMEKACRSHRFPTEPYLRGFFSFAQPGEINEAFEHIGRFQVAHEMPLPDFLANGWPDRNLYRREAQNLFLSMLRRSWKCMCEERGFLAYEWSKDTGFHVADHQVRLGQRIPWGRQGEKRSSALRNAAKGHVWSFGATAIPSLWPYPHFRLKLRVLFALQAPQNTEAALPDKKKQHRLRRTICKGWRNKQWHGRLMALLELLSGELAYIQLPFSAGEAVVIDASPVLFTAPVTTELPDELDDEQEETDESTITVAVEEEAA